MSTERFAREDSAVCVGARSKALCSGDAALDRGVAVLEGGSRDERVTGGVARELGGGPVCAVN